MKFILATFVSSAALLAGVEADGGNPYPCKRPNCHLPTFNKNQCVRENLCGDCDPDVICDRLCDSCDYQEDGTYAGVPCECPPPEPDPPVKCLPQCLLEKKGKWTCTSQQGCEECDQESEYACDIMCGKCDYTDPLGGLVCDCPHEPDTKCFAACEASPKGLWVCGSDQGCAGCDPETCDTLCDKCGGYGYQEFGGLECDCGPPPTAAPTAEPGPGKCFEACGAYPKGLWVCDSIQGCDGCDPSICGTLCDKCGFGYGYYEIAGLTCHCD